MNERELVLEALLSITRDGEYSHIVLKNLLDLYQYLDKRERAFITRVVNGTLERMIEIDAVINQFSKVKVNKMKPVIRTILRFSVYQLKYMDSIPDSAVCNEAVKLAAKKGFHNLKGFVNGVLRNISRNLDQITYPDPSDPVSCLSVRESLPEWLVSQWLETYDFDTVQKMGESFLKADPLSVRFDPQRITKEALMDMLEKEGVTVREIPDTPSGLYLSGFDHLAALSSFRQGYYQVQDVSSMQAALWADPKPGDEIIDVCAAPGGKAIHLAELLSGTGHVEARDLTEYKVGLIRENIERTGLTNISAVCRDASVPDRDAEGRADLVIADLPCSGLGVIGKKPDLKYKASPEGIDSLVRLQQKILSCAQSYVKPGGTLIYSTCTVNPGENIDNVHWFLQQYPEFSPGDIRDRICPELRESVVEKGCIQLLPGVHKSDGFFIARLVRNHGGNQEL